jgi:hypothetical protein
VDLVHPNTKGTQREQNLFPRFCIWTKTPLGVRVREGTIICDISGTNFVPYGIYTGTRLM